MNYRLNELTSFPGWDTRANTDVPVNPRLPNSPLYTYDPQTGAAGFDVPREYNISKSNPVTADGTWIDKEAGKVFFLPQLIPGQYSQVPHYRESYNLPDKVWDESTEAPTASAPAIPSDDDIIKGILQNKYGNGDARKQALAALGLSPEDIKRIQGLVNARMYAAQARPAKRRKPAAVPVSDRPRQERILYQGMPMNSVGQQDPDYIYVR